MKSHPLKTLPTKTRLYSPEIGLAEVESRRLGEILSAPFVTELVAANDAPRLAWVVNERGVRNIWSATAPDFEPRPLTRFSDDDGRVLSRLQLSADGRKLIFIRGGESNRHGEHPNPDSDPRGAERVVWALDTEVGEPWRVTPAASALLVPGGERLIFTRGGEALEIPLVPPGGVPPGGAPRPEPMTLFQARGSTRSLACSPSGRFIAFISFRHDHSFVGVFDRERQHITWIAPEVDLDGYPIFSPDGSRLAFLRYPGLLLDEEPWDPTKGIPFEIWVGDPETGEGRRVWRSPGPDGDFAQHHVSEPLTWAGNDRLVFASEHEGWIHFYAVPATGGRVSDLTPGAGEVESGVISRDGSMLYYSSNHGDIHRRHLWRVPVTGGPPEIQTPGQGIETDPVRLAGSRWLACRAGGLLPPEVQLVEGPRGAVGGRRFNLSSNSTKNSLSAELPQPRLIGFTAADGVEIYGQLFLPVAREESMGLFPGVVFLHGGPVNQMLLGWHPQHYYGLSYAFNQFLADRGFVVLAVNFRAGTGYGRAFRQAPGQGARGAAEYQDVVAAARYLGRRSEVDERRIGLWGGSYGGYLTALGLARDSGLFAAGVAIHGVFDRARQLCFSTMHNRRIDPDLLELARRSSPVADLAGWTSPVLLIHGDDDPWVPFSQTVDLAQRLRERQIHVETLVFPDEGHDFSRHVTWRRTFEAAAEFLIRFLRPEPRG